MEKKILILKGMTRYNVLKKASDLVAEGFCNRGYKVNVLDLEENAAVALLNEEIIKEYSFIFSFQALLFDYENGPNCPLVSCINTPWFGWIVDDLLYHLPRVRNTIYENTYIFTVDHSMKQIANQMYSDVTHVIPLIHGGFSTSEEPGQKEIDVLFPGTVGQRPDWYQYANGPMPIETFLVDKSIQFLRDNPEMSVRQAIEQVLNHVGEELTGDLLLELGQVIGYVDSYIRYECKYNMLKALLEAGIHVHVVGEGHDELIKKYSHLVSAHGACEIDQVIDLMRKSRIVINPCPAVFEQGFHERIMTAMLCKSAIFTPYTKYAEATMGKRLELVNMKNLSTMSSRVKDILNDFDTYREDVLEDNYVYAKENHTWEKRGEQIIDFFESGCNLEWSAF